MLHEASTQPLFGSGHEPDTLRAIIFDFGGVFTKVDRREELIRQAEHDLGLSRGELLERMYAREPWLLVSTGRIDEQDFRQRVLDDFGRALPPSLEGWERAMFAEEINHEVVALAAELRPRYRLALLSNAAPSFDPWLAGQIELRSLFDVVVISALVGLRKPNPGIYHLTAQRLGVEAQECLFVDDKERNTLAAAAVGMTTIVFRSAPQLRAELKTMGAL